MSGEIVCLADGFIKIEVRHIKKNGCLGGASPCLDMASLLPQKAWLPVQSSGMAASQSPDISAPTSHLAGDTPRPVSDRLIVALDFSSADAALALARQLQGTCRWMKVGLELYLSAGSRVIDDLREQGFSVFLDLKLHDIPNTVAGAVRAAARAGASLLTVHAVGGPAMLRAAAEAAAEAKDPPRLLAVTVLTSMDAAELSAIGIAHTPAEQVLRLAQMATASGISGLVCSPQEVGLLRHELGEGPLLVTPGIRPAGSAANDQKRMASPGAAMLAGASYLVVGRPITQAEDPQWAARQIVDEIKDALALKDRGLPLG